MTMTAPMEYLTGSGWVDRPTSLEPQVEGEVSCDVAVVGGGIGGMSATLRLAELGIDAVLIEADVCGWGASGRNAGFLSNHVGSTERILNRFYKDRVRGLMRASNAALEYTEGLIRDHDIDCHYEQSGVFVAAVTPLQLRSLRKHTKPGGRTQVISAQEAGLPSTFLGGIHAQQGGVMNPGEFALGLRDVVKRSSARVFEQSPVDQIEDHGADVVITTARGRVRANRVILTSNAFMPDLSIAPKGIVKPVRVTAVETEPVSDDQLDEAGWTSRTPFITAHWIMESYRTTERGTISFTTRQAQMPRGPIGDRQPDQSVVADLVKGFQDRFPGLADVQPARAWGGWIAFTPSNLPMVGQVSPRVYYSIACNGHGLPKAPYQGRLLADHVAGRAMDDDLRVIWRTSTRFAPGVINPLFLKAGWVTDRVLDRVTG